jgi:O-6-methylguanine DNA methyltransferase
VESVDRSLYVADGWGVGEVWTSGVALVHHVLAGEDPTLAHGAPGQGWAPRQPKPPSGGARAPSVTVAKGMSRECRVFVTDVCRRFRRHLAGHRVDYDDVPVLHEPATPFECALFAALRGVPWGEVVTYGELAGLAGRPGAARAAGSFCAAGGASLVLPYHRVVAAGGIGGYGPNGVETKRRLLALEGVDL